MGVGAVLYMCDVVKKSSRSLSHLLMSSCKPCICSHGNKLVQVLAQIAHGTCTKFGARFRLFTTIHSVSKNENIRHFCCHTIMRLMQTVLYIYVKLNIWCLCWRLCF